MQMRIKKGAEKLLAKSRVWLHTAISTATVKRVYETRTKEKENLSWRILKTVQKTKPAKLMKMFTRSRSINERFQWMIVFSIEHGNVYSSADKHLINQLLFRRRIIFSHVSRENRSVTGLGKIELLFPHVARIFRRTNKKKKGGKKKRKERKHNSWMTESFSRAIISRSFLF